MTFERRLQKLEARLTDRHGLVPHTQPWREYWFGEIDKLGAGEEIKQKIPLAVLDDLTASDEAMHVW